jgi:hypothetical protein
MKISSNKSARLTASKDTKFVSDLKRKIKSALDEDLCIDVINLAFSEDDDFSNEVFIESDIFWDTHSNDDMQDIVLKFFNGEDLDSKGPANPNRDYFRFNRAGNVESTDYPGDIYLDQLKDEVIDYIMDHLDDREFPLDIQELIDEYQNDKKE